MKKANWETKQRKLYEESLGQAKADYMATTLAYIDITSSEPDKDKNYPKWERWKIDCVRSEKAFKKAINNLSKAYIRLKAFNEVEDEYRHKEQTPKEYK